MDFSQAKAFPDGAATVNGCYSYLDCDVIIIDKYVPSRLDYDNLALAQDELPGGGTIIYFDSNYDGTLALRVPNDPSLTINITIDGEEYEHVINGIGDQPRHALVSGPFEVGCRVKLEIGQVSRSYNHGVERPTDISLSEEVSPKECPSAVSPEEHPSETSPEGHPAVATFEGSSAAEVSGDELPEITPSEPAAAHDPALLLKGLKTDNGNISFNDSRSRFFLALEHTASEVTLTLPAGYDFEVDGECSGAAHVFAVSDNAFTGFEMRVYTPNHRSFRDFDLAIMQAPSEDASGCSVHAYTPIIGAFSGETCYTIDLCEGAPVKIGTHGTTACQAVGIDPATGYKWGRITDGSYYFELENGGYEILVSFTGTGARLIANPGTPAEKVLVRESTLEEQRYGFRVTEGYLILSIESDDCSVQAPDSIDISTLVIRAIDTIAIESGYTPLGGKAPVNQFTDSFAKPNSTIQKETPARTNVRPEVQTHINNKLAAKKNKDAATALGIATGAVAVTAGIISLLSRDKK